MSTKKISPTMACEYTAFKNDDKFFDSQLSPSETYVTNTYAKPNKSNNIVNDISFQKEIDDEERKKKEDEDEAARTRLVMHRVELGDTLDGLMLQYGVSKTAIKKYNNLQSDDIYYLKELKIPNPTTDFTSAPLSEAEIEEIRKQTLLDSFKAQVPKDDRNLAKLYMEEAEYDVEQALKLYKEDLDWEKANIGKLPKDHQIKVGQSHKKNQQHIQLTDISKSKKTD
jgi:LysM repeat protein